MKVKAVYTSKVGNKSIVIGRHMFVNNVPTIKDVNKGEFSVISAATEQGWMKIIEKYDVSGAPVKGEVKDDKPVEIITEPIEEVTEEAAPVVENSKGEELKPVEEITESDTATEETAEETSTVAEETSETEDTEDTEAAEPVEETAVSGAKKRTRKAKK